MIKKLFPKYPPFINRIQETKYLNDYLKEAPSSILFVYGPKSTGKTTLINKVINELPQKAYVIQYIDMRGVSIIDHKDFIIFLKNLFFQKDEILSLNDLDKKYIETNILGFISKKLFTAQENGIHPVIILDEFQYLMDIVLFHNIRKGERPNILLVEELFKFLIAITKQNHLAHVICITSNRCYITDLDFYVKLKNTSNYFLVDHLEKKDIIGWLKDEDFEDEVIEYFWEHLGGSVWEIWQCLMDYKNTGDYKTPIQTMIDDEYAKIFDLIKYKEIFTKEEKQDFLSISKIIAQNGEYIIKPDDTFSFELIKKTVDLDIWFFDARKQRLTANSQTTKKAFERI